MKKLKEKLSQKLNILNEELSEFLKINGDQKVDCVKVKSLFGGLRDVIALNCETSYVSEEEGVILRNIPIKKLIDRYPEEILFLLLTGELPNDEELNEIFDEIRKREKEVPFYIFEVIDSFDEDTHPLVMLSCAITLLDNESLFNREYERGLKKDKIWEYYLEDSLNIIAWSSVISAYIYKIKRKEERKIFESSEKDWAFRFCDYIGIEDVDFKKFIRLFLVLHSDHEAGNVSTHSTKCVASTLSSAYCSFASGFNGLRGPLHGTANQSVLRWLFELKEKNLIDDEEGLKREVTKMVEEGRVVPGFGHSILKKTDPRFEAFYEFGEKVCPDFELFKLVKTLYRIVPEILKKYPKIRDPYPNIDFGSGFLLYYFGLKDFSFYPVLFALSRTLGLTAQVVISRAINEPIENPKSISLNQLKNILK